MIGPLPDILEQEVIPPPLHGLNPRTLMGESAWRDMRRQIYRKHGHTCAACGVAADAAILRTGLEAHERFRIDYRARRMYLTGMEPLCHACHAFVHAGLLEVHLAHGKSDTARAKTILRHGIAILDEAKLRIPHAPARLAAKLGVAIPLPRTPAPPASGWSGWQMIWEGNAYPSPYPTEKDWQCAMKRRG